MCIILSWSRLKLFFIKRIFLIRCVPNTRATMNCSLYQQVSHYTYMVWSNAVLNEMKIYFHVMCGVSLSYFFASRPFICVACCQSGGKVGYKDNQISNIIKSRNIH